VNPTREQVLEDLQILVARGFRLIRMYDSGAHTETALELIREHGLPIKVLLGIWLKAELSNHERNEWLKGHSADRLAANVLVNAAEVERGIALAGVSRTSSSRSTSATRRWWIDRPPRAARESHRLCATGQRAGRPAGDGRRKLRLVGRPRQSAG